MDIITTWWKTHISYARLLVAIAAVIVLVIAVVGLLIPDSFKLHPIHKRNEYLPMIALIVASLIALIGTLYEKVQKPIEVVIGPEQKFLEIYSSAISNSIQLLAYYHLMTEDDKRKWIVNVLSNICTVSDALMNDGNNHAHKLNACIYQFIKDEEITLEVRKSADQFFDKGRKEYSQALVLSFWAFDKEEIDSNKNIIRPAPCIGPGFALPIDDNEEYTLFGAPYAFKTKKPNHLLNIENMKQNKLQGVSDKKVWKNVLNFFKQRSSYRSFISIPIIGVDNSGIEVSIGVLCIQSIKQSFCNVSNDKGSYFLSAITPFTRMLAIAFIMDSNKPDKSITHSH